MKAIPWVAVLFMASIVLGSAQTMTTKQAKVVVAVNPADNTIRALVLFTDRENREDQFQEQYSKCNLYIGLMEGSYEVVRTIVRPKRGTTVNIFYNQPLSGLENLVMEHYSPGDFLKIGNSMARVISNIKGELILKIQ